MSGYVIIDTETTGLGSKAEIIQFCGILTDDKFKILDIKSFYCMVDSVIPEGAVSVHGITNDVLLELCSVNGVPQYFEELIKNISWVCEGDYKYTSYNWDFDARMIDNTMSMQGLDSIKFGPKYPGINFSGRGCFDSMLYLCNTLGSGRTAKLEMLTKSVLGDAYAKLPALVDKFAMEFGLSVFRKAQHDALYDCVCLGLLLSEAARKR